MFKRCRLCGIPVQDGPCQFATYKRTINGREYSFCCVVCAEMFEGEEG